MHYMSSAHYSLAALGVSVILALFQEYISHAGFWSVCVVFAGAKLLGKSSLGKRVYQHQCGLTVRCRFHLFGRACSQTLKSP